MFRGLHFIVSTMQAGTFSNACFDKADRREMSWRSEDEIRVLRIKNSWIRGASVYTIVKALMAR